MARHATGARLPCVRAAHVVLPLRAALLATPIRPEVVEALTNCRAGRIAGCSGRRKDVTPEPRPFGKVGISGQEVVMRIRSNASTERLPIIVIADDGEYEIGHIKARFPSIPILRKPFRLQDLTRLIDDSARSTQTNGSGR